MDDGPQVMLFDGWGYTPVSFRPRPPTAIASPAVAITPSAPSLAGASPRAPSAEPPSAALEHQGPPGHA